MMATLRVILLVALVQSIYCGTYIVSDTEETSESNKNGQQSSETSTAKSVETMESSDLTKELQEIIMDYRRLKQRAIGISKVFCNTPDFDEETLKSAFMCFNAPYRNTEWYQKCSNVIYGEKWTYKQRRDENCANPRHIRHQWRKCVRTEYNKNRYDTDGTKNSTEHGLKHVPHRRERKRKHIQWDSLSDEEKKQLLQHMRERYKYHLGRLECVEKALGIQRE